MSTTQLVRGRIGETVERHDGVPKVTGEFAYSSDLNVPGMLHGATLRSPHAHARILSIDISKAVALPGVHAVLTHADVPGAKTYGLEFADQPVLAIDRVRYDGEPVAVVAAQSLEHARQAVRAIAVEYEPLPAGRRHGARHRDAAAPPRPAEHGARLSRRSAPERRALGRDQAWRPVDRG